MVTTNIGVEVTTGLRSGPANSGEPSGIFHIAGLTERGPVAKPTLVTSVAQYLSIYGGRTPYSSNMLDTARLFFEEGGAELLVSRAVGPNTTKGSLELKDVSGVATLKVEAAFPGAYSAEMRVAVTEAGEKFTLTITDGDSVIANFRNMSSVSEVVQRSYSNQLVNIVDMGSATSVPNNNPVAMASAPLSAGSDDRRSS